MPRFVLLIHDHPFVHWDFLVECRDVLRSWRLLESPDRWLARTEPTCLVAEPLADHRLAYLDHEGPVSRERGHVVRWDHGSAEWMHDGESSVTVQVLGGRLIGRVLLERVPSQPLWSARYLPDVSA
jgi:hypothetical protein